MKKFISRFSDDELIFECSEIREDLIYSAACHTTARYIVNQRPELLKEIFTYFEYDEDDISEFNSFNDFDKVAELGEKFYDDSNWIFVTAYIE